MSFDSLLHVPILTELPEKFLRCDRENRSFVCLWEIDAITNSKSDSFDCSKGYKWHLSLCLAGNDQVQLGLHSDSDENCPKVTFRFSILNNSNEMITKTMERDAVDYMSSVTISVSDSYRMDSFDEDDKQQVFNILFEMFDDPNNHLNSVDNLAERFKVLFGNGQFSDVTLVSGNNNFPVHKLVLSARSEVFRAMFQHDMKENQDNKVLIEDVEPVILKQLLRFIYTDQVSILPDTKVPLLKAAHKYRVEELMKLCELEISRTLSVEDTADILILADSHNLPNLRARCSRFIHRNTEEIMKTESWQRLKKYNITITNIFKDLDDCC